ncbi:MAG: tetratricopeptide repeat protein [Candidatus Omnitrophica bacterium]|nr:tetratricopeptide repeat protein [Candidatus Omnitrophota bacterium]
MAICKWCKKEIGEGGNFCGQCSDGIQNDLTEAKKSLGEYDFQKAIEKLNKVLEVDSENTAAKALKKETEKKLWDIQGSKIHVDRCFKNGLYKEAIFYLEEILKIMPLDEQFKLQKKMSEVLSLTDPRSFIRESQHKFKPSDWAKVNYYIPSNWILAVAGLAIAVSVVFLSSHAYQSKAEKKTARDIYKVLQQKIAKREYYSAGFMADYGKLIENYGSTEYARKMKGEFTKVSSRIIQRHMKRGKELFDQGRYTEAIAAYSKALEIEPFYREALSSIQKTKERMALKELSPSALNIRVDKASLSRARVDDKKELSDALAGTDIIREHMLKGHSYFERGRYDEAIQEWEKAIVSAPQEDSVNIQSLIEKAKEFRLRKETGRGTLIKQGDSFIEAKDWHRALSIFKRALVIRQNDPEVLKKIDMVKSKLSSPKSADAGRDKRFLAKARGKSFILRIKESLSDKHQERKRRKALAYYNKAQKEEKKGMFLKANSYYKKANKYKFDPLAIKQIKVNSMIEELKKQQALFPEEPILNISLGSLYYSKGWFDKAEGLWDGVFLSGVNQPLDPLILGLKAKAAEKRGQFAEAKDRYEESLSFAEIFYIRNSLAKLICEKGFYDEAIEYWKGILENNPYQLDVINSLTEAYIIFGRYQEAEDLLEPLTNLTPLELRKKQTYPLEVDPEYLAGIIQENEYYSRNTFLLSHNYSSLGNASEAVRWHIISIQMQDQ